MHSIHTKAAMSIQDRFVQLLNSVAPMQRRGKWLEEQTGIPASKWTQLLLGRQKATVEMIEEACGVWPQYAEWLTTGQTGAKQQKPITSTEELIERAMEEVKRAGNKSEFEAATKRFARAVATAVTPITTKQHKNGDHES